MELALTLIHLTGVIVEVLSQLVQLGVHSKTLREERSQFLCSLDV